MYRREGKANFLIRCKGERVLRLQDAERAFPWGEQWLRKLWPCSGEAFGRSQDQGRQSTADPCLDLKTDLDLLCIGLAMKGQSLEQFLVWMKCRGRILSKTPVDLRTCCLYL